MSRTLARNRASSSSGPASFGRSSGSSFIPLSMFSSRRLALSRLLLHCDRDERIQNKAARFFQTAHRSPRGSARESQLVAFRPRLPAQGSSMTDFVDSLPHLLGADQFRELAASILHARVAGRAILWGIGGHVVKCGLAPVLIDLMDRELLTALAMNGAAAIHDL